MLNRLVMAVVALAWLSACGAASPTVPEPVPPTPWPAPSPITLGPPTVYRAPLEATWIRPVYVQLRSHSDEAQQVDVLWRVDGRDYWRQSYTLEPGAELVVHPECMGPGRWEFHAPAYGITLAGTYTDMALCY